MMHIDRETYKIKEENRYKQKTNKTQIVIGFSLRKDNYHIVRLQHKEYGGTKKWNAYSISREGNVFEHYDPIYYSDYMGVSEIDKKIISIVLENMCSLIRVDKDVYINWLGEKCSSDGVINKKFLGLNYWESFPNEQIESTVWLCRNLCERFNIPKKIIEFHHYNENVSKFSGIVLKSNYVEDSTSINPVFDLGKFNELLQKDN